MIKKILLRILENQKEIKAMLDPRTIEKCKKYDEIVKNLENVKLKVKNVSNVIGTDGLPHVIVSYGQVVETVIIEGGGSVESSPMFKAINLLDLISYGDMRKVSAAIDEAKKVK